MIRALFSMLIDPFLPPFPLRTLCSLVFTLPSLPTQAGCHFALFFRLSWLVLDLMKLCFESSDCVETFFLSCGPDEVSRLCCLVWRAKLSAVSSKTCSIDSTSIALLHPATPCRAMSCRGPTKQQLHLPHSQRCPKGILRHTAAY